MPRRLDGGDRADAADASPVAQDAGDASTGLEDAGGEPCLGVVSVDAWRIVPTVHLLIDSSASMGQPLQQDGQGPSRWNALYDALMGTDGVIRDFRGPVKFGLTVYGTSDTCPVVAEVAPAAGNFSRMRDAYSAAGPDGFTATGVALQHVVDSDFFEQTHPRAARPAIVLFTDDAPTGCAVPEPVGIPGVPVDAPDVDYQPAENAVHDATRRGITTRVVSLAREESDGLARHFQTLANLGQGLPADADPGAEVARPGTSTELARVLRDFLHARIPCHVELERPVNMEGICDASDSNVRLDARPLECGRPNGWTPVDATTLQLHGEACAKWKTRFTTLLDANFACERVLP